MNCVSGVWNSHPEFFNTLDRFWHLARSLDHMQEMQTGSLRHHPDGTSPTKSWLLCFRGRNVILRPCSSKSMVILELMGYNEKQELSESKTLTRHLIMNYHQEKLLRHPILGTMPGSTSAQPRITSQDGYRLALSLTVVADRGTIQSNDGRAIWHCTVALLKKGSDANYCRRVDTGSARTGTANRGADPRRSRRPPHAL